LKSLAALKMMEYRKEVSERWLRALIGIDEPSLWPYSTAGRGDSFHLDESDKVMILT